MGLNMIKYKLILYSWDSEKPHELKFLIAVSLRDKLDK